jgi:hypothetical protein
LGQAGATSLMPVEIDSTGRSEVFELSTHSSSIDDSSRDRTRPGNSSMHAAIVRHGMYVLLICVDRHDVPVSAYAS